MTIAELEPYIFIAIKIAVLIVMGLYLVFALVLVRQEQLMSNVVEESFRPVLKSIVFLHLLAAVGVFLIAFILL